jgi:hypothetical protein
VSLTFTRNRLLEAVGRGRVQLAGGAVLLRSRGGANRRCDKDIRWLVDAGLVRMGPDGGTYEPTESGWDALGGPRPGGDR